jgi:hypothetical protein
VSARPDCHPPEYQARPSPHLKYYKSSTWLDGMRNVGDVVELEGLVELVG